LEAAERLRKQAKEQEVQTSLYIVSRRGDRTLNLTLNTNPQATLARERERVAREAARRQNASSSVPEAFQGASSSVSVSKPVKISIKLPQGITLRSDFSSHDPVSKIYAWVSEELGSAPETFIISKTYPSKDLIDLQASLAQAGLESNALLLIQTVSDLADSESDTASESSPSPKLSPKAREVLSTSYTDLI